MHCAPDSASFRKGVTFWASLINNLVAFVGAFISVFVDKHCANSAQSSSVRLREIRVVRIMYPTRTRHAWSQICYCGRWYVTLPSRATDATPTVGNAIVVAVIPVHLPVAPHVAYQQLWLCACASWLRCFDTAPIYLRASFPNANCLRILNEPLKYRTQWLRPPEARAAGTRARNAAVNESPAGRGRRVGEVQPR